jgi:hypothetical protein
MSNVILFPDNTVAHELGHCDPVIDLDTHWLLLALMSNMVRLRDARGDSEIAALVYDLGRIIARHEPSQGGE